MQNTLPFLAITMGDAAGIGPEVVLKALAAHHPATARPLLIGDFRVFRRASDIVGSTLVLKRISDPEQGDYRPGVANVLDPQAPAADQPPGFGAVSASAGRASVDATRMAHALSRRHPVKAILAAPLQKQAISEAGFSYGDECELMADLTGAAMPMMLLVSDRMRIATVPPLHVSLKQACENISRQLVLDSIGVLRDGLASFGVPDASIAVAALNPHGGEGGLMGREEIESIVPAVQAAQARGWKVHGPFPADSLYFRAAQGEFDAVLGMYHDQGRIAMKTLDFGRLVSAMIGVPVPYLTVAHGTAYEIAGTGKADARNFIELMEFVDGLA